ncbi:MAG: RimK family alpha-L-glutamate ligase [Clostridia bacterium]|nr:RimK family alpha-L-glutamate ligase [Clostridia bacterium]
MKAAIIVNGFTRSAGADYQPARLKEEFEKAGVAAEIIKNYGALCKIINGEISCDINADFCVFLDKDKYLSAALEKKGVKLFNKSKAIEDCDDKAVTFLRLSDNGVPMPDTITAPLCYTPEAKISDEFINEVVNSLGLPLIIKTAYGSLGNGVFLAQSAEEVKKISDNLKCVPHLYQKFIKESYGRDVRVIVIGGKVFGAIKRVSDGDFRSNLSLGGKAEIFTPDEKLIGLAEKTARLLGLDYCGIDFLFTENGFTVCEVNSNAFFKGFESATGLNVAEAFVRYILKSTSY